MNKDELSGGKLRIAKNLLKYEQSRLAKLDENVDDINLINKINNNIELHKANIAELEK